MKDNIALTHARLAVHEHTASALELAVDEGDALREERQRVRVRRVVQLHLEVREGLCCLHEYTVSLTQLKLTYLMHLNPPSHRRQYAVDVVLAQEVLIRRRSEVANPEIGDDLVHRVRLVARHVDGAWVEVSSGVAELSWRPRRQFLPYDVIVSNFFNFNEVESTLSSLSTFILHS